MTGKTSIEWATDTWNPLTGCTKVSPGCDHCYAIPMSRRVDAMQAAQPFRDKPRAYAGTTKHEYDATGQLAPVDWTGQINLLPERLEDPLRATKPRRYFVNSMSDLFHDKVPDDYIASVFAVMAYARRHTFMVLTKRHARMRSLLNTRRFFEMVEDEEAAIGGVRGVQVPLTWPIPNLLLGVSVENQQWANIRIPALLDTPAAIRFLSCEPLLGPVDLRAVPRPACTCGERPIKIDDTRSLPVHRRGCPALRYHWPDWVITGGESGPGARPMHPAWVRLLRDQCETAGVPFLFKQWGAWAPRGRLDDAKPLPVDNERTIILNVEGNTRGRAAGSLSNRLVTFSDGSHCEVLENVGKKQAGRVLDGRTYDEFPTTTGAHE